MQIASAFKIRKTNTTVNDVCPHASARVRVAHSAMSDFSSHLTATDPAPFARRAARRTVTYHSIARSTAPIIRCRRPLKKCTMRAPAPESSRTNWILPCTNSPPDTDLLLDFLHSSDYFPEPHSCSSRRWSYLEIGHPPAGAWAKSAPAREPAELIN
ncbi:hypothetical protein EVAR_475_1 [Eumeta japonica]|uniref:Uncharacterized protein n=1 Tax=Eumeta variegata TaxID=151549 RepID=A0A4C1SAE9_EUMVA|nr:hypothetical protein EVAR_475_1 [Eumeta japonica]